MTGFLTTHVLDTALGRPAEGLEIALYRLDETGRHLLKTLVTNDDGRTDEQILPVETFAPGTYELVFQAGAYLTRLGAAPDALFLDEIPIRFTMTEASHYHVPLLLSPYGYSTYRGS